MTNKGTIVGRVCSAKGNPIAEATVFIASGPSHADIASLTGDDGCFVIDGLKPGAYAVRASALNFESETQRVRVSGPEQCRADFKLAQQVVEEMD